MGEEAIFLPAQKCPYHVTFDLDRDFEHTLMYADLESIVCKLGGDPAICLRELMVGANSHEFITLCTLWTN